jgi:hypothetical protein
MRNSIADRPGVSRWDELKEVSRIAIDIAGALDDNGIDLIFLNRLKPTKGISGVTSWKAVEHCFRSDPDGTTPLVQACHEAFSRLGTKPLLVLIATDGQPDEGAKAFEQVLKERRMPDSKSLNSIGIYVSILGTLTRAFSHFSHFL